MWWAFQIAYNIKLIFWIAVTGTSLASTITPGGDYEVGLEQLVSMSKNQNISALQQSGGVGLLQRNFVSYFVEAVWFSDNIM